MRVAVTDRTGLDASPLTIHLLRAEWDQRPALGTLVCAHGPDGWRYIGPVTALDELFLSFTILPVAFNTRLDNIGIWRGDQHAT